MFPLPVSSLQDIPLVSTPLLGCSFAGLTITPKGKQDHSPSDSPDCLHAKRTHVTSPEVEVRSEHSSTRDNYHMPNPTPKTRTDSGKQWWESPSPSASPTRGPTDPNDDVVAGSSKSIGDQVSSDFSLSRGNWVDSDLDTTSGDCLSCSDTDEMSVRTAHKKYRKRVRASYKLSKGVDWTETQMKRIKGGHQDVWGHNHKIIRAEQKHTLADDHTSFRMRQMATRTNQLIHLAIT